MSRNGAGDTFDTYLEQIRKYPLLSPDEEREIARAVQRHDWDAWDARERLIKSNLRLVVSIARRHQRRGLEMGDLVEEGNIGLVHAVEKFDPEHGVRFSTYATWWIEQAIRRALTNTVKTVRIPAYMAQELQRWYVAARAFAAERGREPTEKELVAILDPPQARRRFLLRLYRATKDGSQTVSLDVLFDTLEAIVDPSAMIPGDVEYLRVDIDLVLELVGNLPARHAEIVKLRFGLDESGQSRGLREIASIVGLSRERVRQIIHESLEMLRRRLEGGPRAGPAFA